MKTTQISRASFLFSAGAALMIGMSGVTAHADTFGFNGANGPSGGNGANGAKGQDATLLASGQAQVLNLAGGTGGDGGNAYDGASASSCFQPGLVRANLFGASGGNGGDAGQGGRGGDGGNLVVYFTQLQDLRNIAVDASPGFGGRSGRAGIAGAPCGCNISEWAVPIRVCRDVVVNPPHPDHINPGPVHGPEPVHTQTICENIPERHFCTNGSYGRNGSSYANGSSGQYGLITLIQSATPLTAVQPTTNVAFGNLPQSTVLTLDKWSTQSGASVLFAPGSRISDHYRSYAGRVSVPVNFVWNASRAQSNFTGQSIATWVDENGKIKASLQNNSVFAVLGVSYDASGAATVAVNTALLASDVVQLSGNADSLIGTDEDVVVKLNDAANVSDIVQTQISAVVKSDGILDHTRFEGQVPANLIEHSASGIVVHIGQLQGIPSGDLKNGKKVKITLNVTRSLGEKSATQTFQINGKLSD